MLKKVVSDESGRTLGWTLIIMAIGVLLIPTFLSHASANLFASRVIEENLKEQYAADAGVEHAIFLISTGEHTLGESFNTPTSVNNLPVSVMITVVDEDKGVYQIVSEAGGIGIESNVTTDYSNLAWLLQNAVTSAGNVTIRGSEKQGEVIGDVMYSEEGVITGEEHIKGGFEAITMTTSFIEENWPSASDLSGFYWTDVKDLESSGDDIVVSSTDPYIGPLYRVVDGNQPLMITSDQDGVTVVLSGTIYVKGDLEIGKTLPSFTLDLNGQTIYVQGEIKHFGDKCTITGSGCIIAEGDIFFEPKVGSSDEDFVLIMSVDGTSQINPKGSIYGSVVGDADVILQPGCNLTWTSPYDKNLNFPNGSKGFLEFVTYRIYTR